MRRGSRDQTSEAPTGAPRLAARSAKPPAYVTLEACYLLLRLVDPAAAATPLYPGFSSPASDRARRIYTSDRADESPKYLWRLLVADNFDHDGRQRRTARDCRD